MAVCPYNRKKYDRIFSYKNYYNERFEIASNQGEFQEFTVRSFKLGQPRAVREFQKGEFPS